MTCQEYQRLTMIDPATLTRAERVAHVRHYHSCPTCRTWFDKLADESEAAVEKLFGTGVSPFTAEEDRQLWDMAKGDSEDPEA